MDCSHAFPYFYMGGGIKVQGDTNKLDDSLIKVQFEFSCWHMAYPTSLRGGTVLIYPAKFYLHWFSLCCQDRLCHDKSSSSQLDGCNQPILQHQTWNKRRENIFLKKGGWEGGAGVHDYSRLKNKEHSAILHYSASGASVKSKWQEKLVISPPT